jgi:hypothetical protein
MDRWARPTLQPQLISCHYVRYALIRCLVYTTDPAEAERIAACALARACLASRRLGGMADPGLLVELLIESTARGQRDCRLGIADCGLGEGRLTPEVGLRVFRPFGFRSGQAVFRGFESVPTAFSHVADVLNGMSRFARDLLILHYIEGLSRAELGEVHRVAVPRIRIALAEARLDFIERLGEYEESVCGAHPTGLRANDAKPDVQAVLMGLAGALNQESVRTVGEIVRQYVADIE